MPVILYSSSAGGTVYTLNGEIAFQPSNSTITSTAYGTGIYSAAGGNKVTLQGSVFGGYGVYLGDSPTADSGNHVFVADGGFVYGSYGVVLQCLSSRLENHGEIFGHSYAAALTGSGTIINSGTISSDYIAISVASGAFNMTNTGTVRGDNQSYVGSNSNDSIINAGRFDGNIALGGAADTYDGRQGGLVNGTVNGGDGNDNFFGATSHEDHFDGGAGIDTLRFTGSAGAVVFLSGGESGGAASGDTYVNIENVSGSNTASDKLYGSTAGNILNGRGGTDFLSGGSGNDSLIGGDAKDTLVGGAGNDAFIYYSTSEIGDVITDFGSSSGNNDVIRIDGSAFGGGLATGALLASQFRSGAYNTGQDANDRFILRTTDMTLWFDRDGKGGAAPVMVADLHQTVHFSASDIFIF